MLSEYAHPNRNGTLGSYGKPNHETLEVTFGKYLRNEKTLKKHVENTLILSIEVLEFIEEKYNKLIHSALEVCKKIAKGKTCAVDR